MEVILIFGGVLAVIGVVVAIGFWMDRLRRDALKAIAEELGLPFYPDGFDGALQDVGHFKLFTTGRAKKMTKAILAESEGTSLCIFDYQYTVGHGKHSHTHRQTVAAVRSPGLQMPDFAIKNEGFFNKLGSLVGMQDIDFESHPNFSKMFLLTGSNEEAVRKLFRPALLEYFETKKGISVEAGYGAFVFFNPGKKVKPEEIKQFMTTAYEIYGHLVDSVESLATSPTPNA